MDLLLLILHPYNQQEMVIVHGYNHGRSIIVTIVGVLNATQGQGCILTMGVKDQPVVTILWNILE